LALLGMKLRSDYVVPSDDRRKRPPVVSNGDEVSRLREAEMIAVDKIGVGAPNEAGEQRMRGASLDFVPPHVRDFQVAIAWFDRHHLSRDPTEARRRFELASAFRHELHPDADAEERASAVDDCFVQRLFKAGNRGETTPAIG